MDRVGLVAQVAAWSVLLVLAGCDDGGGPVGSPPTFTELATGLTGVDECSLAWGDADNDGDLDLAVAGHTGSGYITKVYENRNGQLDAAWELATGLTVVYYCSLAWGDADNDGDLDLAVAGDAGSAYVTKVYETRNGQLDAAWELATGLPGVAYCSLAWGDADNDGDLDLAVAGDTGSAYVTKVYETRNGRLDAAWELATGLTGVYICSLAWGDADNDGDLDLAVAGHTGSGYITKVYENDDGAFDGTELATGLPGVGGCSLAWGDADNDGDLDLAVAGYMGSAPITKVYENRNGQLDAAWGLATGLTGVTQCSLAWGDADNDGDLDLAVAGYSFDGVGARVTKVYENRNGQLDAAWELATGLTGVLRCSLAWGDADNDGDLDLVVAGLWTGSARITKFYENDGPLPNTRPGAPTGLEHVGDILGFHVLQCNAASDAETPAEGLSYNLMVREASGLTHVYPAMADETTGARRVPALGPVLHRKPYVVFAITLPPGDYEARVQAIDTAFEGGAWSQPCLFTAQ